MALRVRVLALELVIMVVPQVSHAAVCRFGDFSGWTTRAATKNFHVASSPSLPASAGLNDEIRRYQVNNLGRVLLDEEVDSHHKNNFFDIWYEGPHS